MQESKIIQLLYPNQDIKNFDDCALIPGSDSPSLHTTDSLSEGTHFNLQWSTPEQLAIKLIHSNISDMISSGGIPEHAFLNLGLPATIKDSFIESFASSLHSELTRHKIKLIGGDTFRSSKLQLTMHLTGSLKSDIIKKRPNGILRSSGKPGERLYVTGNIGKSFLGYKMLKVNQKIDTEFEQSCVDKHLMPRSRIDLIDKILKVGTPTAMMDLSDGLLPDAYRLAQASQLSIHINMDFLPVDPLVLLSLSLQDCVTSGEELELLFLSDSRVDFSQCNDLTQIGQAHPFDGKSVHFFQKGIEVTNLPIGFSHWQ